MTLKYQVLGMTLKMILQILELTHLDGRRYAINVWTFKFLKTAKKEEIDKNYIIPPDLFVKELTRNSLLSITD